MRKEINLLVNYPKAKRNVKARGLEKTEKDREIADKYIEWEMRCPTHLSTGQEAVATVVGHLLKIDDLAISTHRSHAHYLGKGGDLK